MKEKFQAAYEANSTYQHTYISGHKVSSFENTKVYVGRYNLFLNGFNFEKSYGFVSYAVLTFRTRERKIEERSFI